MINQPSYLKEGDKVALVSPAYWMPEDTLIQTAEVIRRWGLQPAIGPHTNSLNVNVYAGTGSNSCLPLIEGAPCSLDVTLDKAVLTFNVEGSVETYDIGREQPQLMKPELAAICID